MVVSADNFCKFTHRIEELKLKIVVKLHKDNRKLKKEFKHNQISL